MTKVKVYVYTIETGHPRPDTVLLCAGCGKSLKKDLGEQVTRGNKPVKGASCEWCNKIGDA